MADKDQEYKDTMRLRKAVQTGIDKKPNSDRLNMGTYVPGFEEGRTIDVEDGMKGLREAENELKRESSRGDKVKKMASGGSASSRADGIAQRGKTRGKMC